MHNWHKSELHRAVPELIRRSGARLGVQVQTYLLQRVKTRSNSYSPTRQHIRLYTELFKRPKALLECVVVHEMAHLQEVGYNKRFVAVLDQHWPQWRESWAELNALPLVWEDWDVQVP